LKLNYLRGVEKKLRLVLRRLEESLFSLSPSFYAMVSGAVIGAATNLVTSLLSTSSGAHDLLPVKLGILGMFLSAVSFGHICLILEGIRDRVTEGDALTKRYRLLQLISGERKKLWISMMVGFVSVITGIILVANDTVTRPPKTAPDSVLVCWYNLASK
jgi:hypothetical protein